MTLRFVLGLLLLFRCQHRLILIQSIYFPTSLDMFSGDSMKGIVETVGRHASLDKTF